jgi:hypothetical protein
MSPERERSLVVGLPLIVLAVVFLLGVAIGMTA